jgi:hypothetical protein
MKQMKNTVNKKDLKQTKSTPEHLRKDKEHEEQKRCNANQIIT